MPVNFKLHINYDLKILCTLYSILNASFPWSLFLGIWNQHGITQLNYEN